MVSKYLHGLLDLAESVRHSQHISHREAERYISGMYSLDMEADVANTRIRLVGRWRKGIDRPMLREYKVLYYVLGQLLERVGER